MEEQFILRVPPSVAARIDRLLTEATSSSVDRSLDLSFSEDGRNGTFTIANDHFEASLLDLPCVVESYKSFDDNVLIKTADVGQMIMVREEGDSLDSVEYRHGLTPPMRDARKRRFRREPDLNPEVVQRVERDLLSIMAGGTADNIDILIRCAHAEVTEHDEDAEEQGPYGKRGAATTLPTQKSGRSDTDDSI